jgi:hypothetical protein
VATKSIAPTTHDKHGLVHALHASYHRILSLGASPHLLRMLAGQINLALNICRHEEIALRNLLLKVEGMLSHLEHEQSGVTEWERIRNCEGRAG